MAERDHGRLDERLAAGAVGDVEAQRDDRGARARPGGRPCVRPPPTVTPSDVSARTVAAPMPHEAPVTIAVLPRSVIGRAAYSRAQGVRLGSVPCR